MSTLTTDLSCKPFSLDLKPAVPLIFFLVFVISRIVANDIFSILMDNEPSPSVLVFLLERIAEVHFSGNHIVPIHHFIFIFKPHSIFFTLILKHLKASYFILDFFYLKLIHSNFSGIVLNQVLYYG